MNVSRRAVLGAPIVATLVSCAGSAVTLGSLATDAGLVVAALQKAVTGIETADPNLLGGSTAKVNSALAEAASLASGITASTPAQPTGATTVQTIDNDINTVLDVAAGIPLIPPPYDLAIGLAAALAPEIETGVNALLGLAGAPLKAGPRAKLRPAGVSADEARAGLRKFLAAP